MITSDLCVGIKAHVHKTRTCQLGNLNQDYRPLVIDCSKMQAPLLCSIDGADQHLNTKVIFNI